MFCHKSAKINTLATVSEGTRMAKMLDYTQACHARSEVRGRGILSSTVRLTHSYHSYHTTNARRRL